MATDKAARLIPWDALEIDETFNARQRYDGIGELAANIREQGLITPLEVQEREGHAKPFFLIGGFRRARAIGSLRAEAPRGKPKPFERVAVRVFSGNELEALLRNLAENGGRKDLRLWELGARCVHLRDTYHLDAPAIAQRLGYSKAYVYQSIKVTTMAPAILAHCKRSDVPVDLLVRWSARSHDQQLKEFHAWQQQKENKAPRGNKQEGRSPDPLRLAKERAAQAPILLRAIKEARKPKAWREGAAAAVKYMAGRTGRPPVPLSPK